MFKMTIKKAEYRTKQYRYIETRLHKNIFLCFTFSNLNIPKFCHFYQNRINMKIQILVFCILSKLNNNDDTGNNDISITKE